MFRMWNEGKWVRVEGWCWKVEGEGFRVLGWRWRVEGWGLRFEEDWGLRVEVWNGWLREEVWLVEGRAVDGWGKSCGWLSEELCMVEGRAADGWGTTSGDPSRPPTSGAGLLPAAGSACLKEKFNGWLNCCVFFLYKMVQRQELYPVHKWVFSAGYCRIQREV